MLENNNYLVVNISIPSQVEAKKIAKALLKEKLVACAKVFPENSMYWWNGEVLDEDYWNLNAFTIENNKDLLIKHVKNLHSDEVPAITFHSLSYANSEFLTWIDDVIGQYY